MGYPKPIPDLKGKNAKAFDDMLRNFTLTESQKELVRQALREFPPDEGK
jgi:hypothetical protein